MNILPRRKITFSTYLSKDKIRERIARASMYRVAIDKDKFEMIRIINYRNSFLPQIKGQISDLENPIRVNVTMRLHPVVLVFMSIWLSLVLLFCTFGIINFSIEKFDIFQSIPFSILLLYVPFNLECSKSKKDLLSILDAEIVK